MSHNQNTPTSERVAVAIDGFNLYHGLRDLAGRRYLWLDLEALALRLLKPGQSLQHVRYFTAHRRNDPMGLPRQKAYLQALAAHSSVEITLGRFQKKRMSCRSCGRPWITYEEKKTDVAIAVSLVEDAAAKLIDTVLLISADSDLSPGVEAAKRLRPGLRVIAVFPPMRRCDDLTRVCDAIFYLGEDLIRNSQLPGQVVGPAGRTYKRPVHWN